MLSLSLLYIHLMPHAESSLLEVHDDDDDFESLTQHDVSSVDDKQEDIELLSTPPPLPHWNLSESAVRWDAFALAQDENSLFWQTAAGLRNTFAERYGGETTARGLLDQSLITFDLESTACRLQTSKTNQVPFQISFAGYSVTTGRGNFFSQSYPMVLEKQLHTIFRLAGIDLRVRNAAIGGCPSFPYGWCLRNFLGDAPDVVSWDFAMNEAGGDPSGLEAYLRQVATQYSIVPQIIIKDTHLATQRRELVDYYRASLLDPLILHDAAVDELFQMIPEEEYRPVGLQEWRKFGAPRNSPGQTLHHPAVAEHELLAWLLTLYFLSALELLESKRESLQCEERFVKRPLPPPLHSTNATWDSLLFGDKKTQCRTSLEPIVNGKLQEIVQNGVAQEISVILPKSNMFYNQGWVYDLSDDEKKAKRNLDRFGNLGFVDSKTAYFGLFESGNLTLFVPSLNVSNLVLCEVNEQKTPTDCELSTDTTIMIGGLVAKATAIGAAGTLYLGKKICSHVVVPSSAKYSCASFNGTKYVDSNEIDGCKQQGLRVQVAIHNKHINRKEHACSISQVIWN